MGSLVFDKVHQSHRFAQSEPQKIPSKIPMAAPKKTASGRWTIHIEEVPIKYTVGGGHGVDRMELIISNWDV